jgi:hypothetical protein
MSEKKTDKNTKPGRKGGIMIHLTPELEKVVDAHAARMRARIPGVDESVIGRKEAIQNILHQWEDELTAKAEREVIPAR